MISYIGYTIAVGIVIAWGYFDRLNFKAFFTRKGFKYGASSGGVVAIVLVTLVALAYVSQKATFNKKLDVTTNKVSSLAEESIELVGKYKEAEGRVTITGFFLNQETKSTFERIIGLYQGHGAPFDLDFVDISTDPDKVMAAGLTSENTAIFEYGGRDSRITEFNEEEITNVLLNILKEGTKTIYFTKGHGEPSITADDTMGFSIASKELAKQKITVGDVSLLEQAKVPEDADLVVVGGPQYDLNDAEIKLLDDYLVGGGAVVVSVAPAISIPKLREWAAQYGLMLGEDILLMDQRDPRVMFFGQTGVAVSDFNSINGITKKFSSEGGSRGGVELILSLVRSVNTGESEDQDSSGYEAEIIAKTSNFILKFDGITSQEALAAGLDTSKAQQGTHGVVGISKLTSSENKDGDSASADITPGQLVVIGSSHVFNNNSLRRKVNRDFMGSVVSYLTRDENFVSIPIKEFAEGDIDLTSLSSRLFYKLIVWIYPFLILGATILYWQIRKRKAALLIFTLKA